MSTAKKKKSKYKPVTATQFTPSVGQVTFDSEGTEGGRFHSRIPHVPGPWSGVTIGRGYDMGCKTASKIKTDLIAAKIAKKDANKLSGAAGLKGADARKFIKDNGLESFEITELAQQRLFEITYADEETAARGACKRAKSYGTCDWSKIHPRIKELVVDLKYRGDYHSETRKFLQNLIIANDLEGLKKVMSDRKKWDAYGVPSDRFNRRKALMQKAVAEEAVKKKPDAKGATQGRPLGLHLEHQSRRRRRISSAATRTLLSLT